MNKKLYFIFLLSVIIFSSCESKNSQAKISNTKREGRIGIRVQNNSLEFYDKENLKKFTPKGYNYTQVQEFTWNEISISGHSTFNPEYYSNATTKHVLQKLQTNGYNSIRIFINPISISNTDSSLNHQYILNLIDFIKEVDNFGLAVIITMDMIPINYYSTTIKTEDEIWWWNTQYIYGEEIDLEILFWQTLIKQFKNFSVSLEAILAYEIRNEFFFHPEHKPFNENSGIIEQPIGNFYDMSNDTERKALMENSFLNWSSLVRDGIRELDPEALVTIGFYAPEPLGNLSKVALTKSNFDFIDLHLYPESASFNDYATYFDLISNKDKLIIMGEFGIVKNQNQNMEQAKQTLLNWKDVAMNEYNIDGWLLWTWETGLGVQLSISDKNNILLEAFSPVD